MKDSSIGQQNTTLESEGQSPDRFRSFRPIAQTTIASAIGIGAIYFLGRSYLDAYYRYFGIAPGALSFSTADYMFSCPNVILMLIVITFFILGTWKSFQNEQPFFVDTAKKSFKEHIDELIMLPLLLILALSSYFAIMKGDPQGWAGTTHTSYIAFMAGLGIGGLFFFAFWLFYYVLRSVFPFRPFTLRPRQFFGTFWLAMVFVLLFAYLPYLSGKVAEHVAFVEFQQFPEAIIVSSTLPPELQAPLVGDTYQVSAKVIVINNDTLYIFKSNPDNVPKTSTISPSKGDIYAIKISDIKCLVYHPSGQPDR